jgi:outer membrane receptor protein involved in Fe transport
LFIHARYRVTQPFSFLDRLELHAAFQEINDDRRSRDFGTTLEQRERNRSRMTGVTLQLSSHWSDWIFLTYGAEVYLDTIASSRIGRDIEPRAAVRQQSRFADCSTLNSIAGYIQSELWLHPRHTPLLGGRMSYFDIDIPRADREVGVHLGLDDLTGSASLIFHATPSLNLVTNVGRGFRVPNVFDLSTLGPRPGNRFNIPNLGLDPERVVTVDVGAKWDLRRFRAEVFGFYSDFQDKITDVPTGDFTAEGRQVVQSQNLNAVELWGVEAAGRWSVSERWEVFGSFTYTWAQEEFQAGQARQKEPASRIPPANGQVGGLYTLSDSVWIEGFLRFAADQNRLSERDTSDPRINPNGTPAWVTASLRAGWQINEYMSIKGALENMFDKSYREHGSGINAPGVNAIVSVETRF